MLNFITWTANPNLYDGFVTVRWYGLMFAIGFLVGYEIVYRIFRHEGAPERWLAPLFFYVVIARCLVPGLVMCFFMNGTITASILATFSRFGRAALRAWRHHRHHHRHFHL